MCFLPEPNVRPDTPVVVIDGVGWEGREGVQVTGGVDPCRVAQRERERDSSEGDG